MKKIIHDLLNNYIVLILIGYLLMGAILYSSWMPNVENFLIKFYYLITHYNYQFAFIYPTFLFLLLYILRRMLLTNIIIRFKNRKEYFKYFNRILLMSNIYMIAILIICTGIAINIYGFRNINMINYNNHNIFLLILIALCKIFIMIIIFNRLFIYFYIKINSISFSASINFLIMMFLYITKYFIFESKILNKILLYNQLSMFGDYFVNLMDNLYFLIFPLIILFFTNNINYNKKDFIGENL